MTQRHDLTDIGNALSRVMDNPMTRTLRSGAIGVLGVVKWIAILAVAFVALGYLMYGVDKIILKCRKDKK